MAYVAAGLLLSWLVVRETRGHAAHEMQGQGPVPGEAVLTHGEVFRRTSLTDPNLSSVSLGIGITAVVTAFSTFALGAVLLGVGTAMVCPTLLAAIGDVAHSAWRAFAVGVYRLWRDLGYAVWALIAGITADLFGVEAAVWSVTGLTMISGVIAAVRMTETAAERRTR